MDDYVDLSQFIGAQSEELCGDDLLGGAKILTVSSVRSTSNPKRPIKYQFTCDTKDWMPCKTMIRVLHELWGADGRLHKGRSMKVFRDPNALWQGKKVGGVRISELTDIQEDTDVMVTVRQGVKAPWPVKKLVLKNAEPKQYPEAAFKKNLPAMLEKLASGEMTKEQIVARCEQTGALTEDQKAMIKLPETEESGDDNFFGE